VSKDAQDCKKTLTNVYQIMVRLTKGSVGSLNGENRNKSSSFDYEWFCELVGLVTINALQVKVPSPIVMYCLNLQEELAFERRNQSSTSNSNTKLNNSFKSLDSKDGKEKEHHQNRQQDLVSGMQRLGSMIKQVHNKRQNDIQSDSEEGNGSKEGDLEKDGKSKAASSTTQIEVDEQDDEQVEEEDAEEEVEDDEDEVLSFVWEDLRFKSNLFHHFEGSGLYPKLAMINHSCVANSCHTSPSSSEILLFSSRALCSDEEITISYIGEGWDGVGERRAELFGQYGFTCKCKRCLEEEKAAAGGHHVVPLNL